MKKLAIISVICVAIATMLVTTTGCETESVQEAQLTISPSEVTVAPGGTVKFTASGGWIYSWKVSSGYLSTSHGETVTYTAPTSGSTNSASTATITVSASTSTNNVNLSATAVITIK